MCVCGGGGGGGEKGQDLAKGQVARHETMHTSLAVHNLPQTLVRVKNIHRLVAHAAYVRQYSLASHT